MSEQVEKIRDIRNKHEKSWLALKGVVAIGIGKTSDGSTGIVISVKKNPAKYRKKIPAKIDGIAIDVQETGEIKAL